MIDVVLLREQFELLKTKIQKKEPSFDLDTLQVLDEEVRVLRVEVEQLRKERNELAKQGAGGITDTVRQRSIELGKQLKNQEQALQEKEVLFKALVLACPNVPFDDLPVGGKEANKVVRTIGEKPSFSFTPKNHVQLNESLGWFDFKVGAQMSGAQFVVYQGLAAKIQYALLHLMLKNNAKHGYAPTMVPYLVSEQSLVNSGNLPKFAPELYKVPEDGLYVIPTSEVPLTNIYAQHILSKEKLPIRMTALTSCFRREAGGYGSREQGLIRMHQFEKVEIYTLCVPEDSSVEQERMLACAEDLLKQLGLHYRVSLLAAGDCSFQSAKTYDIEVWLPGQQAFYEISSVSNCTDFQARRAQIRFRETAEAKPQLVHTLNGSSLALPRLMVALMEQGQQEDGSIKLPLLIQEAMNILW